MLKSPLSPNENRDFFDTLKKALYIEYLASKHSLSKNYPNAPVSGKIGTGVLTWMNGRKTHVEMWYSWTLTHWYRRIICCER